MEAYGGEGETRSGDACAHPSVMFCESVECHERTNAARRATPREAPQPSEKRLHSSSIGPLVS